MPKHVINLVISGLNKSEKSINGSKILIIGVAYKNDIDDCRESPALDIIELLQKEGSSVKYHDPYVDKLEFNEISLKSISNLNSNVIRDFDACIILTNHSNVDYSVLAKNSKLIIDTRNVLQNQKEDNIIRLGHG